MTYRDDREALRARVHQLEAELERTRADRDRAQDLERALAHAQRRLDQAQRALSVSRGATWVVPAGFVLLALAVALAGATAFLLATPLPLRPAPFAVAGPPVYEPPLPPCDGAVFVPGQTACAPPPCSAEVLRKDGLACVDCPLQPRWDAATGTTVLACEDRYPEGWTHRCDYHGWAFSYEVWCRAPDTAP